MVFEVHLDHICGLCGFYGKAFPAQDFTLICMPTIHCISGLGADQRMFQKLDIPGAELKAVPWPYFDTHDEMACYAQKVAALIPQGPEHVILGLSFGGMLASEIARMRPEAKVIIISSAKSPGELPPVAWWVKFLGRNGLMPVGIVKLPFRQVMERFGADTAEEQKLMQAILRDTDNHFASCALRAMIEWKSTPPPESIVHIHGTADAMILPDRVQPTYWIRGGKHIMIYSRAEEISALIAQHVT
jgi:pimeloyl-ACP methyl ester carboxylesterase